jgi:hypothetical protein
MVGKQVGERPESSPTGNYSARLQVSEASPQVFEKRLIIQDARRESIVVDLPIERSASIVWCSGKNKAVVIDSFASNENRLIIIDLDAGVREVIDRQTVQKFDSNALALQKYSHVYFRNVRWINSKVVACKVEMFDPVTDNVPSNESAVLEIPIPVRD